MSLNERYIAIRRKLDELNFHQPLSVESLLLVESLLSELCYAKQNVERYYQLSQLNKEKNTELEAKFFSFKEENQRLIKESSTLQLQLIEEQENFTKIKKDLKHHIIDLESKISDLEFVNAEQSIRIKELEEEEMEKTNFRKSGVSKVNKEKYIGERNISNNLIPNFKLKSLNVINEYISHLSQVRSGIMEELAALKTEKENLLQEVKQLKLKLSESDHAILRLKSELKEIIKLKPPNEVCSCHEMDLKIQNINVTSELPMSTESIKGIREKITNDKSSSCKTIVGEKYSQCKCSCPQGFNKTSDSVNNLELKIVRLEESIASLQKQVKTEWFDKENLRKKISSLENEKRVLIKNLETVTTAEKNVLSQLDYYIKENAVLKTQVAQINESNKTTKIKPLGHLGKLSKATNTKSERKLKDKVTCTEIPFPITENVPKSESAKDPIKNCALENKNIEDIVKNHLDEYIKNVKFLNPEKYTEKEENKDDGSKKIHDERDFFCREYQRLKEKLYQVVQNFDKFPAFDCPYACLDQISREWIMRSNTIQELLKSREQLKKKLENSSFHHRKENDYSDMKHTVEVKMKNWEVKEAESSAVNERLTNEVLSVQDQNHKYKERIEALFKENTQLKSKCNQYKLLQEEAENTIKNLEETKKISEAELNCAISRLKKIENEKNKIEQNNYLLETEKKCLKKNLIHMDHEKDSLSNKLDKKTEQIIVLEEELNMKKMRCLDLEQKYNKLELSIQTLQETNNQRDHDFKLAEQRNLLTQGELFELKKENDHLSRENRRLKDDITVITQDCFKSNSELRVAKEEVEELKIKLQGYVSEVRRIEDLLQMKEAERRSMLEQLKGLTIDGSSALSKSFENSGNIPKEALNDLQDRLHSYEIEVNDKDNLLIHMEQEMESLKARVKQLEGQLEPDARNEFNLPNEFCEFLDDQKKSLCSRISELNEEKRELKEKLSKTTNDNECLQENIKQAQSSTVVLKNLLTISQKELESKNKDLLDRLDNVESSIEELKNIKMRSYKSGNIKK